MTSARGKNTKSARRAYDSATTRRALLDAGRALFDEVGYERATIREIGERADVDSALISRYFGGKEGLFLAVLAEGPVGLDVGRIDFEPHALVEFLIKRWDERGPSPVSRALASPTLSDEVREQVKAVVSEHLVDPLARELDHPGCSDTRLRAELLVAVVLGVALTRANRTLTGIATASCRELTASLGPIVDAISSTQDDPTTERRATTLESESA